MANFRIAAAAAALCFGFGLSAEAGPRIWTPQSDHTTNKGPMKVISAPQYPGSSVPEELDALAPDYSEDRKTVKTYTVTTVRPSRRSFRRNRALGQRYLGFNKRQYTGQRYLGFKKVYRVRRNVVEVSRATVTQCKDSVVISRSLVSPKARGLRDFRESPVVTIIRQD